ncbi:hypothetical protein DL766_008700 [Monosporascus sp. MC13-8B]|uniref:Uncharacterized protein n=1 Tax=Monosporascus cannonballus TaxID=155416 RepID=A0ABY0H661_9PEZI|nr:hypothetical protein DL763_008272 [Monosporascus cannonballus]RYO82637.1 hypothetical protein DL762_006510 [Monosporascus cannonballus]RYP18329.1 hypothetical protein DL766_008700 [Monosporascus sp. MC13-8B]
MAPGYPPAPTKPEPPQYAEFDAGSKKDADSLPAMPSWEEASSKKVLIEEDSVELEPIKKKPEDAQIFQMNAVNAPQATIPNARSPGARGPYGPPTGNSAPNGYMTAANPYAGPYGSSGQAPQVGNPCGPPPVSSGSNAYMAAAGPRANPYALSRQGSGARSPYAPQGSQGPDGYMTAGNTDMNPYESNDQGYNSYNDASYGQVSREYSDQDQGYAATSAMGQGQPAPHQGYNNAAYHVGQMGQGYPQSRTPAPYYDEPARGGTPEPYGMGPGRGTPANNGAIAGPPRVASPAVQAAYVYDGFDRRPSPGPNGAYGYGDNRQTPSPGPDAAYRYDQRSNTPGINHRPYSPAPQGQYSTDIYQHPGSQVQYTADSTQQYPPSSQPDYSSQSSRPLIKSSPVANYSDMSASPIQNNGGFDFTSGYSRPTSPPEQTTTGVKAYPGYRPYKPQRES